MTEAKHARLQRRIQRYGWEQAAEACERHWHVGRGYRMPAEYLIVATQRPKA